MAGLGHRRPQPTGSTGGFCYFTIKSFYGLTLEEGEANYPRAARGALRLA